jgi:hypothetical protein
MSSIFCPLGFTPDQKREGYPKVLHRRVKCNPRGIESFQGPDRCAQEKTAPKARFFHSDDNEFQRQSTLLIS